MANSEGVFQRSYQPEHIRTEIMPLVFGREAAGMNEQLHNMIRRASSKRDEHAPLYPTVDEMKALETYKHMRQLREQYEVLRNEKGGDHPEAKRVAASIFAERQKYAQRIVEENRQKYFEEADRRRALGQSTSDLLTPSAELVRPRRRPHARAATLIGRFLRDKDLGGMRRAQVFSRMVLAYLGNKLTEVESIMNSLPGGGEKEQEDARTSGEEPETQLRWTCLLCLQDFANRGGLTRHNQNSHYKKGAFDRPFPCPKCQHLGEEKQHIVDGAMQWSNHMERCHGIMYTPNVPNPRCREQAKPEPGEAKAQRTRSTRCLICESLHFHGQTFSRHFNKEHASLFREPFPCPECGRQGGEVITIESRAAWIDHVARVHGRDGQTGVEVSEGAGILRGVRKRKRGGRENTVRGTEKQARIE
jgi:hypothetical protein